MAASALARLFSLRSPGHWQRRTSVGSRGPGHGHVHEAHGLGPGPAVRPRDAGHRDAEVRVQQRSHALGHRDRHLRGHRPVGGQRLGGNPQLVRP